MRWDNLFKCIARGCALSSPWKLHLSAAKLPAVTTTTFLHAEFSWKRQMGFWASHNRHINIYHLLCLQLIYYCQSKLRKTLILQLKNGLETDTLGKTSQVWLKPVTLSWSCFPRRIHMKADNSVMKSPFSHLNVSGREMMYRIKWPVLQVRVAHFWQNRRQYDFNKSKRKILNSYSGQQTTL